MYCFFLCPAAAMTDSALASALTGTLTLKWDPKNLEIRTHSVEKTLEPLVIQVRTLNILFTDCNQFHF